MEQQELNVSKTTVESFTEEGVKYEVDLKQKTCTCPAWQSGKTRPCKHLKSLLNPPPKVPTVSMMKSAMIKSVRLRWTEDAVFWARCLWRFPKERYTLVRRLAIMSGEDGMSLPVSIRAVNLLVQWDRVKERHVIAFLAKLCKTTVWYQSEDGRLYAELWRKRMEDKVLPPKLKKANIPELTGLMQKAAEEGDVYRLCCLQDELAKSHRKERSTHIFYKDIRAIAVALNRLEARMTASLLMDAGFPLYTDGNLSAHAVFRLGHSFEPSNEDPSVSASEVDELVDRTDERLKGAGEKVPSYFLDGVHTGGSDRRFAGYEKPMWGMCRAYMTFGRLHPDDKWPADFWRYEE